jgi:NAD(P)-dependent dehydrogenase (short-subunit alcohol dehydrogenase family)
MKRVLITGANRGIGLEFVGQLLARGDRVFACARRPEQAAELQQFAAAQPERLALIALDVADPASIDQAHRAVSAQTDALDVLINNAGVFNSFPSSFEGHGDPPFGRLDAHNLTEVYRVNAAGPVLMAQRFVDLLRKGSAPKIVNLTSYLGSLSLKHHGGYYAYSASKADRHGRAARADFAAGIRRRHVARHRPRRPKRVGPVLAVHRRADAVVDRSAGPANDLPPPPNPR